MDQCQRLVRKLSETAFPFQCAHGRFAGLTTSLSIADIDDSPDLLWCPWQISVTEVPRIEEAELPEWSGISWYRLQLTKLNFNTT